MTDSEYLPLSDCVDGHIYRLRSRNLRLGIYQADSRAFIGIRRKWGSRFLDQEFHWDRGAPYGTAKPIEVMDPGDAETQNIPPIQRLSRDDGELYDQLFKRLELLEEGLEAH